MALWHPADDRLRWPLWTERAGLAVASTNAITGWERVVGDADAPAAAAQVGEALASDPDRLALLNPPFVIAVHDDRAGSLTIVNDSIATARLYELRTDAGLVWSNRLGALPLFAGVVLLGGYGLILIGDQHIAFATGEGCQRLTRALVENRNVSEELAQILRRFLFALALRELGPVGGHDVPASAAGGEWVGGNDLDAFLQQIVPGGDPLGIVRTNGEDDDGIGHHPFVLVGIPILGDETGLDEPSDVRFRERAMMSAGRPLSTARLCSPEAANEVSN